MDGIFRDLGCLGPVLAFLTQACAFVECVYGQQ
jgi:hypothetical protein